jgi:hypothetical protein
MTTLLLTVLRLPSFLKHRKKSYQETSSFPKQILEKSFKITTAQQDQRNTQFDPDDRRIHRETQNEFFLKISFENQKSTSISSLNFYILLFCDGSSVCEELIQHFLFYFFKKEVRNATEAHTALMRGSPYVPRTLQMQLMRINICRVLRRWNQFIC